MVSRIAVWSIFIVFSVGCILWLTLLVLDATREESFRRGAKKMRAKKAAEAHGPIYIGAAGHWDAINQPILDGINLAADELNRKGGVLGRQIKIVPKDDNLSIVTGMKVAQELANNIDVVAVIGHPDSAVSLSTSTIYEYYGVLMLSPLSTIPKLTRLGRTFVFRNIPTDNAVGEKLAELAFSRGYKRIAIYYYEGDYARELANIFAKKAEEKGITIVDRINYDSTYQDTDFANDFKRWSKYSKLDAILLSGILPQAAECLVQMRKEGLDMPVLSGSLDNDALIKIAGKAAENTIVVSTFVPEAGGAGSSAFVKSYQAKYGSLPNRYAAQGYDALNLLGYVIQKGGTTVPAEMAEILRSVKDWNGVTGSHTFDTHGDVIGKPLLLKIVKDGSFHVMQ